MNYSLYCQNIMETWKKANFFFHFSKRVNCAFKRVFALALSLETYIQVQLKINIYWEKWEREKSVNNDILQQCARDYLHLQKNNTQNIMKKNLISKRNVSRSLSIVVATCSHIHIAFFVRSILQKCVHMKYSIRKFTVYMSNRKKQLSYDLKLFIKKMRERAREREREKKVSAFSKVWFKIIRESNKKRRELTSVFDVYVYLFSVS